MKWYLSQLPCFMNYDLPYFWDLGQGSGEDVVRGELRGQGINEVPATQPGGRARGLCALSCDSVSLHEKMRVCVVCGCCTHACG